MEKIESSVQNSYKSQVGEYEIDYKETVSADKVSWQIDATVTKSGLFAASGRIETGNKIQYGTVSGVSLKDASAIFVQIMKDVKDIINGK